MTSVETLDLEGGDGSEIAIIGMAGRFPGAPNLEAFWRNLRDGVESITFLTDAELELSHVDPALADDPQYVKAAACLEDVDLFDAGFFGYTPGEAEIMDPQQRLFLECAWEALERAGYDPATYPGLIGVFAGTRTDTYLSNIYSHPDLVRSLGAFQIGLGNDLAFLTARLSYKLDLRGPSCAVHTACSTSLVAVHLACQSLLIDECQMALAGGVAVQIPQKTGYRYQPGGIVSPDGHCRAFDARAQGTIFGSGIGLVVLKRLDDALADGDHIHAIIKGSAINNDGGRKASFSAPGIHSQTQVILEALATAGVPAESVTYIEAHGTATPLGDSIELRALTKAFQSSSTQTGTCAIGSVKTNVGHLDAAAGIAGLIKAVLALQHKQIPPSLHFDQPNPQIDFAHSPFYVNTTLAPWKADQTPRRAGVSSFGIGGTNAHVILEEAPALPPGADGRPWQLLVLSARTGTALETATANLVDHLKRHPELDLADVTYTLQVGRQAFGHRRMLVCQERADALGALALLDPQQVLTASPEIGDRPVVFMFPGQGVQLVGMAEELYQHEPVFRAQVDRCAELLMPHLGLDIREVLYPSGDWRLETGGWGAAGHDQPPASSLQPPVLDQTWLAQPALFVIEYALAQLWMAWGVRPKALIGHSLGEYVAACLAGVFSLEDALSVVAARGRLMQSVPGGAMLALPLTEDEMRPLLGPELDLAAINGPSLSVVSGSAAAIDELEQRLAASGVSGRRLPTAHAFHSQMMDSVMAPFAAHLQRIALNPPNLPLISSVTGTWLTAEDAQDPGYWARQLRLTVRFADGLGTLWQEPHRILLEVGPGQTLSRLARRQETSAAGRAVLASLQRRDDRQSDTAALLTALGQLWLAGADLDWAGLYTHERRQRVLLPTYPFERQRYWIAAGDGAAHERRGTLDKRPDIADWFSIPSWKRTQPRPAADDELAAQPRCWLVFADGGSLSAGLVRRLLQAGQDVISVLAGEHFGQVEDRVYTVDPTQAASYADLLKELRAQNRIPSTIVHLWSITADDAPGSGIAFFEQIQALGFYSLLVLAQTLDEQHVTGPVHIAVLSNQLHDVTGEEQICPEKATLLGPCKVIPKEYAACTCCSIDITVPAAGSRQEAALIDQLVAEIAAVPAESIIAYRGPHRWVQTFEPARLDAQSEQRSRLREQGVYLITGGLGGVGRVIAEHLAQTVQAKLILTGRTTLPARAEWDDWQRTHADDDSVTRAIQSVRALEALGAEVLALSADVSNPEDMRSAIAQGRDRFGAIHGVVHAAGVAGGGLIQAKTIEAVKNVLRPKAHGLLVLDALFKDTPLDFMVLFSSISAILGEFGQADYCAANAFLDAFAQRDFSRNGGFIVSINWDTWKEVGMTVAMVENPAQPPELRELLRQELAKGMTSEEGVAIFNRVLSAAALPQIIVSTKDLQATIDHANSFTQARIFDAIEQTASRRPVHPRPSIPSSYSPPRNETEQKIARIWEQILGVEQVGIHDNFFDLGGHSLLATQIIARLREVFQVDIRLQVFFETPTVAGLATAIQPKTQAGGDDPNMIASLVGYLQDLSEDEVDAELARRLLPSADQASQ